MYSSSGCYLCRARSQYLEASARDPKLTCVDRSEGRTDNPTATRCYMPPLLSYCLMKANLGEANFVVKVVLNRAFLIVKDCRRLTPASLPRFIQ